MLKLIFLLLLAANAALFGYGQGYFGHFSGNEHEPARLNKQHNTDQLRLVSAASANAAVAATPADAAPAPEPEPAAPAKVEVAANACLEVGDFPAAEARKFEDKVAALDLGTRQVRNNVSSQEASSYIVHIPPQGSKEGADKKAAELREMGVTNFFVLSESSPLRWGISLGVFRTEAAAQSQLAALVKQGVHSAKVAPRFSTAKLVSYQFRDIDARTVTRLEKIAAKFTEQETRSCKKP